MIAFVLSLLLILHFLVCKVVYKKLLQIRDDPKNGLHVENLTEEYVSSYEDVTQILIKVGRERLLLVIVILMGWDLYENSFSHLFFL